MRNKHFSFNYLPLLFFLLLFFFCFTASSQNSSSELVKKLTDHKREWVLDSTVITLGNKCKNGEALIFMNTNTVMRRYCEDGKWRIENKHWMVLKVKEDWTIWIGDRKYMLILGRKGKKDRMVLRTLGVAKSDLTTDKIFLSEEE